MPVSTYPKLLDPLVDHRIFLWTKIPYYTPLYPSLTYLPHSTVVIFFLVPNLPFPTLAATLYSTPAAAPNMRTGGCGVASPHPRPPPRHILLTILTARVKKLLIGASGKWSSEANHEIFTISHLTADAFSKHYDYPGLIRYIIWCLSNNIISFSMCSCSYR